MLTLQQSARLLKVVFPNYPELVPQKPVPPAETWKK